jgi:hypothetical protein
MQGCDASVLLDGSASGPSEQDAPPNLSLRAKAFEIIDDLRERVHKRCGQVVSCADITAIAARDSVFLVNASPAPLTSLLQPANAMNLPYSLNSSFNPNCTYMWICRLLFFLFAMIF